MAGTATTHKDKFTTMRVYEGDKEALLKKFAGASHIAFNRAITSICTHPEEKRKYMMVRIPKNNEETFEDAISTPENSVTVTGYYCEDCHSYIFRDTRKLIKAARESGLDE